MEIARIESGTGKVLEHWPADRLSDDATREEIDAAISKKRNEIKAALGHDYNDYQAVPDYAVPSMVKDGDAFKNPQPRIKSDEEIESDALDNVKIKFMKTMIRAMYEINQAQPNLFSKKTKQLCQELKALLRS